MTNFLLNVFRSGIGILLSRVFGLVRDIAIAAVYGATGITDIFFVAFAIPNLFRQLFSEGAMASAFMPFLADKFKTGGKSAQNAYLTQLVCIQTVIITVLCLLIMLAASFVIKVFIPGYIDDPFIINKGAEVLRVVMPFLLAISLCGMFAGFLNIHGSYFIPYASSALCNIMMIIGAWFGYKQSGNIMCLAWGAVGGGVVQLVVVYFFAAVYGFKPTILKNLDSAVKKTYLLLVPSMAGVGISQLNFLVGRIIASYLPFGSISWLFYANRLFQFPLGVFSVAVGTVSLTELSKARADDDIIRRNIMIDKAMFSIIAIILPATVGLIGLSSEITALIYERSAFDASDVAGTSSALCMYALGLLFFSLVNVLTRIFHADKDTKTPVKCALVSFFVNILFNLILMKPMGHTGIALASSVAAFVNSFMLYRLVPDYKFSFKTNKSFIIKVISANVVMLFAMIAAKYYGVFVLINIILCIVIYFLSLRIMKINLLRLLR
ncbi:MAG: murein biosynthesis integral membrane protein MurJ [Deferribacterales bacterium]|nr:murein biosynthesis integral membrane protein MurJ [Deferribacterales bacterium]